MPLYKRVVNIRRSGDDLMVDQEFGPHKFGGLPLDETMPLEEFLERVLHLSPGDRIELNFLDDANPYPRAGKPRRPGGGRRRRTPSAGEDAAQ